MTAMRVLAYVQRNEEPDAVQAHLLAQPGVTAVGCRLARFWRPGQLPEAGWDAVAAPGHPAIVAAYAAIGVPAYAAPPVAAVYDPRELSALPPVEAATVVCHGCYAREELAAVGLVGAVIAVNHSGRLLDVEPDYIVGNDGMSDDNVGAPGRVQVVRRVHQTTVSRPWFALDRLGITDNRFSVRCALALAAEALSARRIRLIGHDCQPGRGALPGGWSRGHIETCRAETAADLHRLAASGIAIEHVGWQDGAATIATYEEPCDGR